MYVYMYVYMGMAIHQDQGITAEVSEGPVVHRGNCYDVIYNESGGPKNMGQLLVRPILSFSWGLGRWGFPILTKR